MRPVLGSAICTLVWNARLRVVRRDREYLVQLHVGYAAPVKYNTTLPAAILRQQSMRRLLNGVQ